MKNFFALFSIFLILCSCSGDESNSTNSNEPFPYYDIHLPVKVELISSAYVPLNLTYNFSYDNRHRLITTQVSGGMSNTYTYSYEEFSLKTVTVNGTDIFTLLYDNTGKLSGVLHNSEVTPITYDSTTDNYFYGSHIFKMNDEKDIYLMEANTANPLFFTDTQLGPFYNVLGYHGFAALLTDMNLYYLATRRPRPYFKHPSTGEIKGCGYSQNGGDYFSGGIITWEDSSTLQVWYTYVRGYQYEDIPQL